MIRIASCCRLRLRRSDDRSADLRLLHISPPFRIELLRERRADSWGIIPLMQPLTAAFSLLVAASGWYYMFYSRAATHLAHVEGEKTARTRHRLRQANGAVMFLMGILFYAGFNAIDYTSSPSAFIAVWFGVFMLLSAIVVLALLDLRLTFKMRRRRRAPRDQ